MTDKLIEKHYKTLELDKVLQQLASYASLDDAKELAVSLCPQTSIEEVSNLLGQTDDAYRMSAGYGMPSFGAAKNVNNSLARAVGGGVLSMRELLEIGEVLRVTRGVTEWHKKCENIEQKYIKCFFDALTVNKYFEDKIFYSIKNEEEMDDNASPELYEIRRKMRAAAQNIRSRLEKIVKSSEQSKYLQEAIITQRDGRYVVPVKVEYKSNIAGLVHDTSSSGATLFVEPMGVVEANNELKVLKSKEKEEIERILAALSVEAADFSDTIKVSFEALVRLSLIFAKASLAYDMKAAVPNLNKDGKIYLKNARHPLLPKKTAVPITLSLGKEYDTLIITGPNTGGKTVTIKTIGLLTLMTMCGLMIPVSDGSEISVFDNILADIGDEQSIEQSLSTFSSHMTNIVKVLQLANKGSLVLIDELGAGTDPVEGAALAESILVELRNKCAIVAATTHYAELKSYAIETDGVCNASCEFDVETLRPTYRLIIGIPGKSNAFSISEKLGLPKGIVDRAKSFVSDEGSRFENIVSVLEQTARKAEQDRQNAEKIRAELEIIKRSQSKKLEETEREKERQIAKAKELANDIIERTRRQAAEMLSQMEEIKKKENSAADRVRLARALMNSSTDKMLNDADPVMSRTEEDYKLPRKLKVGDDVILRDLGKEAKVVEIISETQVTVLAGVMKMRVDISNLKLNEGSKKKNTPNKKNVRSTNNVLEKASRTASTELDLRGMNADEAIMELDRFIDNAVLLNLTGIWVIHGKGTGVLRKAVHEYLKTNRCVKSYRLGVYGEGESGVTVVEFK